MLIFEKSRKRMMEIAKKPLPLQIKIAKNVNFLHKTTLFYVK